MIVSSMYTAAANNAAYNWMSAANTMTRMAGSTSFKGANYVALHKADQNLSLQMFNESLMYRLNMLMAESSQKLKKENLKRSLSIFA